MEIPTICSITLGSERAIGVTKTGFHQSSNRLSSLKAGKVSAANVGEGGPSWCGIEDKPHGGILSSSVQAEGRQIMALLAVEGKDNNMTSDPPGCFSNRFLV